MDMPPLTAPDKTWSPVYWHLLLVLACVLVFAFAMHAKVAVYHQPSPPDASTSAKLWLNAERLVAAQAPSPNSSLLGFGALFLYLAYLLRLGVDSRCSVDKPVRASAHATLFSLHRFLRPPPAR